MSEIVDRSLKDILELLPSHEGKTLTKTGSLFHDKTHYRLFGEGQVKVTDYKK